LSVEERRSAVCLWKAIQIAKKYTSEGQFETEPLHKKLSEFIVSNGGKVDYIEFVSSVDLSQQKIIDETSRIVLAVFIGKTRLIDNEKLY